MSQGFMDNQDVVGGTAGRMMGAIGGVAARIDNQRVPERAGYFTNPSREDNLGALLGAGVGVHQRMVGRVVLSLAEIAALQKAADADTVVRAALNKVAHLIDVGVSFG